MGHGSCADVLAYLHSQNPPVIFRDLKPGNIMITPQGQVKLIDFGIARLFKPGKTGDTQQMGTRGYAPPEQYGQGQQTDARSDIYSLGVMLHEALTRHDPASTPFRLPPVRQLNPAVSAELEQIIARATQPNMQQRYQSAAEVAASVVHGPAEAQHAERSLSRRQTRRHLPHLGGNRRSPCGPCLRWLCCFLAAALPWPFSSCPRRPRHPLPSRSCIRWS